MPDKTAVFTDLVDFSDLQNDAYFGRNVQERNSRFAAEVLAPHNARIREHARRFSGSDEGTWGDSFFLVFDSAVEAVQFAVGLLRSFRDAPIPTVPGGRAQLHIGIHTGFLDQFEDSYHGKDISTAARIISLSGTDHILLSDVTRDLCGNIEGVLFRPCGEFLLKGVDGLLSVWEADWDGRGPRKVKKPPLSKDLELPPITRGFVGRLAEIEEINAIIEEHRALFLGGLSGIGKTSTILQTALGRFRDALLADNALFYFDCSARDMRSEGASALLLAQLGRFLVQVGADTTAVATACSESRSEYDRITAVAHALASVPCLLLLDNFQDTLDQRRSINSESLNRVLVFLLTHDLGPSRLIFASFEKWQLPDRVAIHTHTIGDLQPNDARLLLAKLQLRDETLIDRALELVGGHPQALQWFSRLALDDSVSIKEVITALAAVPRSAFTEIQFHDRIARELLDRIWKQLTISARTLLLSSAIFRQPPLFVGMQFVAALDDTTAREARRQLLSYYLAQAVHLDAPHTFHPLVREYGLMLAREKLGRWNELHQRAGLWWRQRAGTPPEPKAGIEAHHHFVTACDSSAANDIAAILLPVLYDAGETAWTRGLLEDARHFDEWRVTQEPNSPDALRYLAQTLARLDDPRAEEQFRRALELAPESPKLLLEYARFLAVQKRSAEAEPLFRASVEADPHNPIPGIEYARFLNHERRFDAAETLFRRSVKADPSNAISHTEYARHLDRQNRLEDAETMFREGIAIDPKMPHIRTEYARFLDRQGRCSEAEAQFNAGIEANPTDAPLRTEYARFLFRQARHREAEEQFRVGIVAKPANVVLRTEFARFLSRHGQSKEAEEQFRAGVEADPKSAVLRNVFAQFLFRQRRTQEAEEQFRAGIDAGPKIPHVRVEYARFLGREGRPSEAERQFRECLTFDPDNYIALHQFARFLVQENRFAEAEEQLRRAIEIEPHNGVLRTYYAIFLDRQGSKDRSEQQFLKGIEVAPHYGALWNEYARFLDRNERCDEAEKLFCAGIEAHPTNGFLRNEYARFLDRQGHTAKAEEQFCAGIAATPNDAVLHTSYAQHLAGRGVLDKAETEFRCSISIDPSTPHNRNAFATFLAHQDRDEEAAAQYLEGLSYNPRNSPLLRAYAQFLATRGKADEAESIFRRAIQITPRDSAGRNQFSMLLIDRLRYEEACEQICAGLLASPSDRYLKKTRQTLEKRGFRCVCPPAVAT